MLLAIADKKGDTEFSKLVHLEKSKREHIENHGGYVALAKCDLRQPSL